MACYDQRVRLQGRGAEPRTNPVIKAMMDLRALMVGHSEAELFHEMIGFAGLQQGQQ